MKTYNFTFAKIICLNIAFIISVNSGFAQWTLTNSPNNSTFECFAFQGTNVLAGNGFGLYKTTDSGATWSALINANISSVAIKDTNVFVGTNYGVYKSTNNGNSWSPDTIGLPFDTNTNECLITSLLIYDTTIFAGVYLGGIYQRNINDSNWYSANTGIINPFLTDVNQFTKDTNTIYAATDQSGYVYKSVNNGMNWHLANAGLPNNSQIKAIYSNGTTIYAGTYQQGIYKSTNQGNSWTSFNSGIPSGSKISSFVANGSCIFSATENNGVYLLYDNDTTWDNVNTGLTESTVFSLGIGDGNIFAGAQNGLATNRQICKRPLSDFLPNAPGVPNGQGNLCAGAGSSSYSTSGSNVASSYTWSISPSSAGTINGSGLTTTILWDSAFTGIAILKVQGSNCFGSGSFSNNYYITIDSLPIARITPIGLTTFCHGDSVILTASSSSSYLWSNNATTESIVATHTGNYSVMVTNANNCSATSIPTAVTVNQPAASQFSQVICGGDSFNFNNQNIKQSGAYNDTLHTIAGCDSVVTLNLTVNYVLASINDTTCMGVAYLFNGHNLIQSGIYKDTLQAVTGCDSVVTLRLLVDTLTVPTITRSNNILQTGSFASYQWLRNGADVSSATTQSITITQNGNYSVVVTNANGCSDTSAVLSVTTLGVQDITSACGVKLYPNPNNGSFILEFADDVVRDVDITDAVGRIVMVSAKVSRQQNFNLEQLATGVYIVRINQQGQVHSLKFTLVR